MARSFNGTSDHINCSLVSSATRAAISAWFNATSLASENVIFLNGSSTTGWGVEGRNGNAVSGGVMPNVNYINGPSLASTGTWHHLIAQRVLSTDNWNVWLDGVIGTQINGPPGTPSGGTFIGFDGTSKWFNGGIADCAIWPNTVLTQGEITALAQGARPIQIRPGSLAAWLPLFGNVSPEPDLSGNGFNGTVTGTTKFASDPPFMMSTPRWPQFLTPAAAPSVKNYPPFQLRAA